MSINHEFSKGIGTNRLICTWDYFYNSGGWDDYPPQHYTHAQKLEPSVVCVSNTAHSIRMAKNSASCGTGAGRSRRRPRVRP